MTFSVVPSRALCQVPFNHISRSLSRAFTGDDFDGVTDRFHPRQQFVFCRTARSRYDLMTKKLLVLSSGTFRVALSTSSAQNRWPCEEFKLLNTCELNIFTGSRFPFWELNDNEKLQNGSLFRINDKTT